MIINIQQFAVSASTSFSSDFASAVSSIFSVSEAYADSIGSPITLTENDAGDTIINITLSSILSGDITINYSLSESYADSVDVNGNIITIYASTPIAITRDSLSLDDPGQIIITTPSSGESSGTITVTANSLEVVSSGEIKCAGTLDFGNSFDLTMDGKTVSFENTATMTVNVRTLNVTSLLDILGTVVINANSGLDSISLTAGTLTSTGSVGTGVEVLSGGTLTLNAVEGGAISLTANDAGTNLPIGGTVVVGEATINVTQGNVNEPPWGTVTGGEAAISYTQETLGTLFLTQENPSIDISAPMVLLNDTENIEWSDFSIGTDNMVRFTVEASETALLNRVIGLDSVPLDYDIGASGTITLLNHGATVSSGFVAGVLFSAFGTVSCESESGTERESDCEALVEALDQCESNCNALIEAFFNQ